MIYLTKAESNELYLNINNNSDSTFTTYQLNFTHVMSQEQKSYSITISDPTEYSGNTRYCIITLDLSADDLNYLGQYELTILGNGAGSALFTGMVVLEGSTEPGTDFIEYSSDNEDGSNYIYIN